MADTMDAAASKSTSFIQKHKTPLIIAGVLALLLIGYLIFRSNQNSGTSSLNDQTGSSTGLPPDLSGLVGPVGPAGPAGPTGATGKRGPTGKPGKRGPKGPPGNQHKGGGGGPGKKPGMVSSTAMHPAVLTASRTQFHTVQAGETTTSVAARHGMDNSTLFGMNRTAMGGSLQVRPGQRLQVK